MKRPRKKIEYPDFKWTVAQDSFLIENSSMSSDDLIKCLPYSEEEIRDRKEVLGLIRRQRQMRKGA